MDINHSDLETSEHMIIWSDGFNPNSVETKSFKCSFCKRGFSNAQALGGHMNIHRKDRAKLKEFSSENLLSLDITKNVDGEDSPPPDFPATKRLSSENDQSPALYHHVEEINPDGSLPFFAEAAPVNGGGREEEKHGRLDKHVLESRKVELINYGELDLELRLGPEPHHAKSKPA